MADKILKIRLTPAGLARIPKGGRIVHAYDELEGEPPTLIVVGDSLAETDLHYFVVMATGWAVSPGSEYITTFMTQGQSPRLLFEVTNVR